MKHQSEGRGSRIIKNVLMNWIAFGATILVGFWMAPFLVRGLGDSVYGVWVLIGSLAGYLGLLDFGLTPSIVKYTAQFRAGDDQRAMDRLVTSSLVIFAIPGAISLAISLLIAFHFNIVFNTPLSENVAAAVVILAGLNLSLTFPSSVFIGLIRGYQRYDIDAAVTSACLVARSIVIVALIQRGHGILGLAAATVAFDLLRLGILIRTAYRLNPRIRIRRDFIDRALMRRLFGYSGWAFLIFASHQMIFHTDSILIGLFLSTGSITVYFIAGRLVAYLRLLVSEMVGVLTPAASEMDAGCDEEGIRGLLFRSARYTMMIALPIATVFVVVGEEFIVLWMGPEYVASAVILWILTAGILGHLYELPAQTMLLGLGKHRLVAVLALMQAVTNLLISLLLIRGYGLIGVALGAAIPMLFFGVVGVWAYFRLYLFASMRLYITRTLILPLIMQAPLVAALLIAKTAFPPASLLTLFILIGACLVPYFLMAFALGLNAGERAPFLRLVSQGRFGQPADNQQAAKPELIQTCAR